MQAIVPVYYPRHAWLAPSSSMRIRWKSGMIAGYDAARSSPGRGSG
jgi:hypothetical protein